MAYTDDAVKAKLSALNETQDSIVTVAQWIMFYRRNADTTARLWLQRVKDSGSNKRLNLIYLANEVAQQSKARRKDDFLVAFSPIIAEATSIAYRSASSDTQNKLRRVVEVWRQRQIFEGPIQDVVEARLDEIDKTGKKKPLLGGSLFSSSSGPSAPPEIQPLVTLQIAVSKAAATTASAVPTADTEYDKLTDSSKPTPTPPVHAARLSALVKNLANAEGAVNESIKARRNLIEGLQKIIDSNRSALQSEETQVDNLTQRKNAIEAKKREVEDGIMRGLSAESSPTTQGSPGLANGRAASPTENTLSEPERPHVEELTPPPPESRTPEGYPPTTITIDAPPEAPTPVPAAASDPRVTSVTLQPPQAPPAAGADLLSSLSIPTLHSYTNSPAPPLATDTTTSVHSAKKRKLGSNDYPEYDDGDADPMIDLDEDVAELLRAESGGVV